MLLEILPAEGGIYTVRSAFQNHGSSPARIVHTTAGDPAVVVGLKQQSHRVSNARPAAAF